MGKQGDIIVIGNVLRLADCDLLHEFKTFDPADELPADEYRWLRHAELGLRMELDLTQK